MGIGSRMVISISKIKNINIIEKKWIENEIRELENGSNPHSKGDIFSRSWFLCLLIIGIKRITVNIITIISAAFIKIKYITLSLRFFSWKLIVIIYLY